MSLLAQLTEERLAAFKSRDKVKATLLATVIAEAKTEVRKKANRDPSDDELTAKIRKFIKNNEEALNAVAEERATALRHENRPCPIVGCG
jgi:uncharacterized protein YqeY